jgi:5'-nucleotidase
MLTILHTNDLHGHLCAFPRLATLIQRERERRAPHALLVDCGDAALGDMGGLGVSLMRALQYDALTTGNHENEVHTGRAALARVGAPCVVANIAAGALGFASLPYLVKEVDDVRVAMLGLTTPPVYPIGHPLHRSNAEEISVSNAFEAAEHWVPQLRAQCDLLIVLSHLGLRSDLQLAQSVSDIDLIIGGHSHHRLPSLLRIGDTHIAQAGVNGAYLGVIHIQAVGRRFDCDGLLEPVWQDVVADAGMTRFTHELIAQVQPDALTEIGYTEGCWADPWRENAWANFVTDRLRAQTDADICFYKATGLTPALDAGPLPEWRMDACLDTSMNMDDRVALAQSGEAIRAICEHAVSELPFEFDASIPTHHCLPNNTLLQASGLRITYDLQQPLGARAQNIIVNGEPLDPTRKYKIVVPEFLAKGYSGFHWFREGAEWRIVGSQRQIIRAALKTHESWPALDGRLQFMTDEGLNS